MLYRHSIGNYGQFLKLELIETSTIRFYLIIPLTTGIVYQAITNDKKNVKKHRKTHKHL